MIRLIAALGNPGPEYRFSRHNIAWQMIEYLSFYNDLKWQQKFKGLFSETYLLGEKIFIIKPDTFMNRSGLSIASAASFYKLKIEEIAIIHDDLELDFGIIGFKKGGGLGGHNGLRSVTASLGTKDFNRFRLGISRPSHSDITSYVLGNFNKDESAVLPTILEKGAELFEENLEEDFNDLYKKYRKEKVLP
ncbi:MAG: aminoacyl-tRNA hydrolase [Acidobacteriota bacterium]